MTVAVSDRSQTAPGRPAASPWAPLGDFPPRPEPVSWPATRLDRGEVLAILNAPPFTVAEPGAQRRRLVAAGLLLDWLAGSPGATWQARWRCSEDDVCGLRWRQVLARWLIGRGHHARSHQDLLAVALRTVISADLVRPSLSWLLSGAMGRGALVRVFAACRDPEGFARLRAHCHDNPDVSARTAARMLHRSSLIMAAKGGALTEITAGDVVELLNAESEAHGRIGDGSTLFYRTLHEIGILGEKPPPSLRQLRTPGQRTPEQMIDRYNLTCRPVRDLLVDYLKERQPALDYNSLESLANLLGNRFWADLEAHHPGICSLNLPGQVAQSWKQRLQTTTKTVRTQTGQSTQVAVPRLSYRECLTPVRAFYLDLAHWAVEDPGRWAAWVAPCPISAQEGVLRKITRQRKARIDARTRERLPMLPSLVAATARHRKDTKTLLDAASGAQPGDAVVVAGSVFVRRARAGGIWVDDAAGKRRNLSLEEQRSFWVWAIVEVLRATGIRIEELLELSHHSLVQYRLPTTGELIPLLQIAPSKTDKERLLVVSPELADVLSQIIIRVRGPHGAVPLVSAYDEYERVWLPPAPRLFQRRVNAENRVRPQQHPARAHRRRDTSRPARPSRRPAPALHPSRLPADVHHRRHPQRPATPHRADHRRPPGHQRHPRLQGRLSRRGNPGPPLLPGPAASTATRGGIPRPHRPGVERVPRPLRTAKGLHRNLRPSILNPLHPRTRMRPLLDALARPEPAGPPRRHPRQPHRPHRRGRTRRLAR